MIKKLVFAFAMLSSMVNWAQEIKRPTELWVFRSVLDKRARVITVALHSDLYVAYDGNNCGVFKVWKEGVLLDGAVYTTKHGPQPTSVGKPYSMGIVDEQIWSIYKEGREVPTKVAFKGYTWKGNKVTFNYQLTIENNQVVLVSETPEYAFKPKEKKSGLERMFTVKDLPVGYTAGVRINTENMVDKTDFVTDGNFKAETKTDKYETFGTLWNTKGVLFLNTNGATKLTTYFSSEVVK